MFFSKKKLSAWWYVGIIGLLIFVPLYRTSPDIWEDTIGYLNFDSLRPPFYPIFLWLFKGLGRYQLEAAMWVQSILNFLVLLYAGRWLHKRLELPKILITVILVMPIIIFFSHFGMLRNIASEAIAFPFFILTFTLFVDSFKVFDVKKIFFLTIVSNILILTREQFYFFYPLFGLLIAWHLWKHMPLRKIFHGLAIILLSILITAFLNRIYHYSVHHYFKDSSGVGELFITQALYLSNLDMIKNFDKPLEKNVFEKTIRQLEEERLTRQSAPLALHPPFTLEIARMHYDLVHDRILAIAKANLPALTSDYEAGTLFIDMSKTLYIHNMKENFRFYVWRVAYFVGGIWIFFSLLIVFFTIIFNALIDGKWNPTISQVFMAISFYTILANAVFVPLFAHFEIRYCYYSYFLYFILCGLLAKEFLSKRLKLIKAG